jgi:predicted enzyme related to lactoylglutathione lyase
MSIKYVHTNIVSSNWKSLADFYIKVFDCIPILPERNLSGSWLEKGTGVKQASLSGIHLGLPGYGMNGPTLEIFQYSQMVEKGNSVANSKGFGHIAFHVDVVSYMVKKVINNGGELVGELITTEIKEKGTLTFAYLRDPEENIIEVQNWNYSE